MVFKSTMIVEHSTFLLIASFQKNTNSYNIDILTELSRSISEFFNSIFGIFDSLNAAAY